MCGEVRQYDEWDHDLSAGYAWPSDVPDTQLTVFVFPARAATDAEHLQQAIADIYQLHPEAQVLTHSQVTIDDRVGLRVDLLIAGKEPGSPPRPSTVLVFRVDGWFVRVRATASTAAPLRPVGTSAESLVRHLNWPQTRRRLAAAIPDAVARSEAAMVALSAMSDDQGSARHLAWQHLRDGDVLGATEAFLSMLESDRAGAEGVFAALQAYVPDGVAFGGGLGSSPRDAVVVSVTPGSHAHVAACHLYLTCALGALGLRSGMWSVVTWC